MIGLALVVTLTWVAIPPRQQEEAREIPAFDDLTVEVTGSTTRPDVRRCWPLHYIRRDFSDEIARSVDEVR